MHSRDNFASVVVSAMAWGAAFGVGARADDHARQHRRDRHAQLGRRQPPAERQRRRALRGVLVDGHDAGCRRCERIGRHLREGPADRRRHARQPPDRGRGGRGRQRRARHLGGRPLRDVRRRRRRWWRTTPTGISDVFRHDRTTGSTIRVSVATGGAPGRRGQCGAADQRRRPLRRVRIGGQQSRRRRHQPADRRLPARRPDLDDDARQRRHLRGAERSRRARAGDQRRRHPRQLPVRRDHARRRAGSAAMRRRRPSACTRVFVRTMPSGTTTRLAISDPSAIGGSYPVKQAYRVTAAGIAGDGLSVAVILDGITPAGTFAGILNQVALAPVRDRSHQVARGLFLRPGRVADSAALHQPGDQREAAARWRHASAAM